MTYKQVATMISELGLPYAYNQFPDGTDLEPPFICFLYTNTSNDMMADNVNYQEIRPLAIELYTDNKDFALEAAVEAKLIENELPFIRQETYLDSEKMFMVVYTTQIVVEKETVENG